MPLIETALLVKGVAALAKAGPVVWTKIAAYVAANGLPAGLTVGSAVITVGAAAWTQEKIEALIDLAIALKNKDSEKIVKNAITVSTILSPIDGIESIDETKNLLSEVISNGGHDFTLNKKAAKSCTAVLTEIGNSVKSTEKKC